MSVGILILGHEGVGAPLVAAARRLLGPLPLATEAFDLAWDATPASALPAASAAMRKVDGGDGVLMLVDLYGARAGQVAARERTGRHGQAGQRRRDDRLDGQQAQDVADAVAWLRGAGFDLYTRKGGRPDGEDGPCVDDGAHGSHWPHADGLSADELPPDTLERLSSVGAK